MEDFEKNIFPEEIMRIKKTILFKVIRYLITAAVLLSVLTVCVSAEGIRYYGYEQLTDPQKKVYDAIHAAMSADTPGTVTLDASELVKPADLSPAVVMYHADHPEVFWLGNAFSCEVDWQENVVSITFPYKLNGNAADTQTIINAKNVLNTKLSEIDSEMAAATPGTDAEKALWLHDKTAEIVDYVFTDNDQTVYGALVEGQAVCSGYARLYQLLLQRNGISAYTVTGYSYNPVTGEPEPHAWTLMWLDGNCLYTDVTWDDQGENLYHLYYCRTLAEFGESHFPEVTLPACECGSQLAYDEKNIFSETTTPAEVAAMMLANDYETVLYFASSELFDKLTNDFLNEVFYALDVTDGGFSWNIVDGCGVEVHLQFSQNVTISGHITSFEDPTVPITIEFFTTGKSEPEYSTTADANGNYSLNVPIGTYILRVSKDKHVTWESTITAETANVTKDVELWLYGDVNLDGEVTVTDATALLRHIARIEVITAENALANAEVTGDSELTVTDATKILRYVAKIINSLV